MTKLFAIVAGLAVTSMAIAVATWRISRRTDKLHPGTLVMTEGGVLEVSMIEGLYAVMRCPWGGGRLRIFPLADVSRSDDGCWRVCETAAYLSISNAGRERSEMACTED